MNITKNSTNQELIAAFPKQVESGKVFIFAIADTKNSNFKQICLAQNKDTGNVSAGQKMFMNWGNKIERVYDEFGASNIVANLTVGQVFEGMAIEVTESFDKPIAKEDKAGNIYEVKPFVNGTTKEAILIGGKEFYHTTRFDVASKCIDTILDRTSVQQPAALSTKANAEKTFA
tara:strand:+ start:1641 stop:2162 length:522 start_codon:yes stop_codon:yes gene_type:complete